MMLSTNRNDCEFMEFEDYKRNLISDLEESIRLFSNSGKKELEVWVVKKFLNTLKLSYTENEIIPVKLQDEPPDVTFRAARFEVMELYNKERQRHREFKAMLNAIRAATDYHNVLKAETWNTKKVSLQELLTIAQDRFHEKKGHYSADTKAKLDVLIYVNLLGITFDNDYTFTITEDSILRKCRSASLVFNRDIVCIVHASIDSPEFIRFETGKMITN